MKFTKLILSTLAIVALIIPATLLLTACRSGNNYEINPVIRAIATQTPTTTVNGIEMPKVLEYLTDGNYNYFLLDIGALQQTFVAQIFDTMHTQGGAVTINMSRTETEDKEVKTGTTTSVSESLSTSLATGEQVTLTEAVNRGISFMGISLSNVTTTTSVDEIFTITTQGGTTRQWSTDVSEAVRIGNSTSFGVTIGPNAEPGYYRAALFANTEIFKKIQTCLDNKELISIEVVAVARGFTRRVEFSPNNVFDNSPISTIRLHNMSDPLFLAQLPIPPEPLPPPPPPPPPFAQISAGLSRSLAVTDCGQLWAWGSNLHGGTGLGTGSGNTLVPTRVGTSTNWAYVSAGSSHSLAVTRAGQLWSWGNNADGRTGRNTTTGNTLVPTRVGTATNWATVSASNDHSLAVTRTGQLWSWGRNFHGRTGLNTSANTATLVPTRVGTATNWASVSAGNDHSLAVTTTGQLWSWGINAMGGTGLNTSLGSTLVPTRVGTATNWATVSAGNSHSLAVTTDGQLWSWGSNVNGRTGLDTASGITLAPTRIGTATNWASVSAGNTHSLAVTTSGQLWSWGSNLDGRTGLNITTGNILVPIRVGTAINWATVSAGRDHSLATTTNNQAWAWGNNANGRLGDGTTINRLSPVQIIVGK